jgi:hypothetical protein
VYYAGMRKGIEVEVAAGDRARLEAIVADRNRCRKHAERARIVLLSATAWARFRSCGRWAAPRRRSGGGRSGSWPRASTGCCATRAGRRARRRWPRRWSIGVLALTLGEPLGEATHWTGRAMAQATGISLRSVQRIWRAHGLQPHRIKTFKLSKDPEFATKLEDIVGLYVDPPRHAVALSVDENNQVALRSCVRPVDAVVA